MKTGRNIIIAALLSVGAAGAAIAPALAAAAPASASVVAGPQSPNTHFYV